MPEHPVKFTQNEKNTIERTQALNNIEQQQRNAAILDIGSHVLFQGTTTYSEWIRYKITQHAALALTATGYLLAKGKIKHATPIHSQFLHSKKAQKIKKTIASLVISNSGYQIYDISDTFLENTILLKAAKGIFFKNRHLFQKLEDGNYLIFEHPDSKRKFLFNPLTTNPQKLFFIQEDVQDALFTPFQKVLSYFRNEIRNALMELEHTFGRRRYFDAHLSFFYSLSSSSYMQNSVQAKDPYGYFLGYPLLGTQSSKFYRGLYRGGEYLTVGEKSHLGGVNAVYYSSVVIPFSHLRSTPEDLIKNESVILGKLFDEIRKVFPNNETSLYKYDLLDIEDYIQSNKGVCRHQSVLLAHLLERAVREGYLSGEIYLKHFSPEQFNQQAGHVWINFYAKSGSKYIIDCANNIFFDSSSLSKNNFFNIIYDFGDSLSRKFDHPVTAQEASKFIGNKALAWWYTSGVLKTPVASPSSGIPKTIDSSKKGYRE